MKLFSSGLNITYLNIKLNCNKKIKLYSIILMLPLKFFFSTTDSLILITSWCNDYMTITMHVIDLSLIVKVLFHIRPKKEMVNQNFE